MDLGSQPVRDEDFPGYREAVERESIVRGASCLGISERICGFEVKPLTAFHIRYLLLVESPFVYSFPRGKWIECVKAFCLRETIAADIMRFFWIISPFFQPVPKKHWLLKSPRQKFELVYSGVVKIPLDRLLLEILEYMDEAWIDSDSGPADDKSYFAFEVSIAEELHEHYGYRIDFWNPNCPADNNPIHVPIKLILQFRKCRQKMSDAKAIVTNKSEILLSDGLSAMNERDKKMFEYEIELAKETKWNGTVLRPYFNFET